MCYNWLQPIDNVISSILTSWIKLAQQQPDYPVSLTTWSMHATATVQAYHYIFINESPLYKLHALLPNAVTSSLHHWNFCTQNTALELTSLLGTVPGPLHSSIYLHKPGYSAGYLLSGNMNHIEDCKHTWCSNMPVSWPTLAADLSISPHFIVSNLLSALWYSKRDNSKSFKVTADELWCRNTWVSENWCQHRWKIIKIQNDDYL